MCVCVRVCVRYHFVLMKHRYGGDCSVIDDLDKMMEVILATPFIIKTEQRLQK